MGKINVLAKEVSELIAAGEVIERPASIVKELLENAADAGATAISIEIRRGGISYIRVTDNGCGMVRDDLAVAFLRHATSKIQQKDDLEKIETLGFRGEALASISAVSRMSMTSKTSDMQFGNVICLEGGELLSVEETGCPDGTTIVINDLFYNVPARLKFMKKDISEANAIGGIVDKIALSHPEISFKFISDNKLKLQTPGNGSLLATINAVFGNEFAKNLLEISYQANGISVDGYVCNPSAGRSNRAMQHFFVNGRYVKSATCMVALEEGYKNSIMVGKLPSCVMNLKLSPSSLDVNVHPAKIEVRFENERAVFDTVYFAVKSALTSNDILKPIGQQKPQDLVSSFKSEDALQIKIHPQQPQEEVIYTAHSPETATHGRVNQSEFSGYKKTQTEAVHSPNAAFSYPLNNKAEIKEVERPQFSYIKTEHTQSPIKVDVITGEVIEQENKSARVPDDTLCDVMEEKADIPEFRIIGEVFSTYLLFEADGRLMLMDKHAAHERIIFESLLKTTKTDDRQILLTPQIVSLASEEYQAVSENVEVLEKLGFIFDDFGNHSVLLREAPLVLDNSVVLDAFANSVKKLMQNRRDATADILESLLHSIACRAAVKANDSTDIAELTELLRQVYQDEVVRHCPHGRPIIVALTKNEIEKKFGRV